MTTNQQPTERDLRAIALAVSVVHDLDLTITDDGILLGGLVNHLVPWADVHAILAHAPHDDAVAERTMVYEYLTTRNVVAHLGPEAAETLQPMARLMALPLDHPSHPGQAWVRDEVDGGVLTRGIGILGLVPGADHATPLCPRLAEQLGLDVDAWWPGLCEHAEDMGSLMVTRLRRDRVKEESALYVRPMGGVDVLGLLSTYRLRRIISAQDGVGMRAIAAPTRSRGWLDVTTLDALFATLAHRAASISDVGLSRVVLVTADSVAYAQSVPSAERALTEHVVDVRSHDAAQRFWQ